MTLYKPKTDYVEAYQVTVENMDEIERWCGGSIHGTKLNAAYRCIVVTSPDAEEEAAVGDFILCRQNQFSVMNADQFIQCYERVSV